MLANPKGAEAVLETPEGARAVIGTLEKAEAVVRTPEGAGAVAVVEPLEEAGAETLKSSWQGNFRGLQENSSDWAKNGQEEGKIQKERGLMIAHCLLRE